MLELKTETPQRTPWTIPAVIGLVLVSIALFGVGNFLSFIGFALELIFFMYFLRHLAFAISALHSGPIDLDLPILDTGYRPSVSVLVACKNEELVVGRLAESLLDLDYPPDCLQLIVINDASTDRTGDLLCQMAASEPRLTVVHRTADSSGGKSGALNQGLLCASGEIVIVFDADHQPRKDVVQRLVRHFLDPAVSAVQGRCDIHNAKDSPLTELVAAVDYLAGYLVNEYGRQSVCGLPAYGGANCAVRASRLRELGGWNPNSVTEDTDLSLRLLLLGDKIRYDVTAVDAEEGVITLERYWHQRYRWARGHQQAWRDYRLAVWRSKRLRFFEKIETTMFLFAFHLPVAAALGLCVLCCWFFGHAPIVLPIDPSVFWMLLFLGPVMELGAGLLLANADKKSARLLFYFMPLFFVSIALCTKAWLDGILGRDYEWAKTARAGDLFSGTQSTSLELVACDERTKR